jgi:hypothetical protein
MKTSWSRVPGLALRAALLLVMASAPLYLALSHFATFEPYLLPLHAMQGKVRPAGPDVLVGPYPDEQLLEALRSRGTQVVISLLDPHLIYEKSLIRRENRLAAALGLVEVHAPMDSSEPPTSPLNAAALRRIRAWLASHPGTHVYIHCYLGKHRAQTVAELLPGQAGATPSARHAR